MKICTLWFCLAAALCVARAAEPSPLSPEAERFLAQLKQAFARQSPGAGMGYALVWGPQMVCGTQGVEQSAVFELGDLLQPLTTLGVSAADGKDGFGWDTPVARRDTGFALSRPEDSQTCTLRQLFGMTAGIPAQADTVLAGLKNPTPEDVFALLRQLPAANTPGRERVDTRVSFLAGAYELTRRPRAEAAGRDFAAWLKKSVFLPLGMDGASVLLTPEKTKLSMRAQDAAMWLFAEANAGRLPGGAQWASSTLVNMRHEPVEVKGNREFGLGWQRDFLNGAEMVSRLWVSPEGVAFIGILPRHRAGLVILIAKPNDEAPLFIQDAFLNLTDTLRVTPLP